MTGHGMIVLAGGRSQRMGRDKAWLLLGGRPVLRRVVQAGLDAGVAVVVVGSPGVELPALPAEVVRVDDPVERRHEGPLSGLAVGLRALVDRGMDGVALSACDSPWLSAAHLRFVLDRLGAEPSRRAVVPRSRQGEREILHPLCGAVRAAAALGAARALLHQGQRAARELMRALDAHPLEAASLPDPRVIEGCNTPQQWSAAARAWEAEHAGDLP